MTSEERLTAITAALTKALSPSFITLDDESYLHIGHPGAKGGKGYYHLTIASPLFAEKNMVACHRLIYAALGELMQDEIHAFRITIPPHPSA